SCGSCTEIRNGHPATLICGHTLPVAESSFTRSSVDTRLRLPLCSGRVGTHTNIEVLRDTGCTVVGVRKSLVDPSMYTGETCHCITFSGRVEHFPMTKVRLETPYFNGEVLACVLDNPAH